MLNFTVAPSFNLACSLTSSFPPVMDPTPSDLCQSLLLLLLASSVISPVPLSRKGIVPRFLLGHAFLLTSDSLPQRLGFLSLEWLAGRDFLFSKIQNFYTKIIPQAFQHFLHLLHANHTLTTWQDFRLVKTREAILQSGAQIADIGIQSLCLCW